ncbi:hypothetical protein BCR44DRAFT_33522 [Catenaria anguillulae PL171]|uniref:BRCT domain-containing protein n=1 Tax=Catenaria anguillulae PL171 TaxID=765915 RepID=A0A1Y2HJE3_9FUNG|nr:hypothetical protein BCR44DRAFT_33522 [Catenaria anguillulae PL171]
MSSGGRSKVEEEIESEDDDQMEVDVQPQVKSTGKAKTAAKDGRKRAVELHVATDETDNEDKMDVDEAPSAAATSNSKRPAAAAAAKKATRKSKAKVTKSESAASALSTPAASRRSSSSKSAAIIDPDQDAPSFTVLFTGGSKAAHDADRALVAKLGGETTDQWQDANVLIVDKVRRTVKFLCSLASGIDIVSPAWLAASKKAKRLMPTDGHALVDREMEAKFGFSLSQSMERRGAMMEHGDRVFSGLRFFVCSGTVPALHDMKEIIAAAGGSLVHSIPGTRAKSQDAAEQGLVAIAGDGVADADQRKRLADLGYALHSAEFVLSGVLKQELDWETHRVGQVKEEDAVAASASFATGRTTRRGKRSG